MEVVCIIFGQKPRWSRTSPRPGAKVADYWEASSKMVQDPVAFLSSLLEFDKDGIGETIEKVEPYIQRDDFKPEIIQKMSKACTSICKWGIAMYTYYMVSLQVAPKRAALAEAQASLEVTKKELAAARRLWPRWRPRWPASTPSSTRPTARRRTSRTSRTGARPSSSAPVNSSAVWAASSMEQHHRGSRRTARRVVGGVISAVVAYSGPFASFRTDLLKEWSERMVDANVPHTPGADITSTLADPVQIRSWNMAGLPSTVGRWRTASSSPRPVAGR